MSERRGFRADALTHLRRTVRAWETDIPVFSTAALSESGDVVIRGEKIHYTSSDNEWLYGCTRGVGQSEGYSAPRDLPGGAAVRQDNPGDVGVAQAGITLAARPNLNFIAGSGITLAVADNAALETSDVTVGVVTSVATHVVTKRTATANVANNAFGNAVASCNADEVCTGGGCQSTAGGLNNWFLTQTRTQGNGWLCEFLNQSGATRTIQTTAMCLQKGM